jgi:hypothetical protein
LLWVCFQQPAARLLTHSRFLLGCTRAGKGKDGSEPTSSEPDLEAGEAKAGAADPLVSRTSPRVTVEPVGSGKQLVDAAAP